MTTDPIDFCTGISRAHASLALKMDDELGTQHGLGWNDFNVLQLLASAEGGRRPVADLVRPMGVPLSAVTRDLVRMEKVGWVQRETHPGSDRREVVLRPSGARLLREAAVTAADICARAVGELSAEEALPSVGRTLSELSHASALIV
jgi:DNA-binding MarR family transcriptional regulator